MLFGLGFQAIATEMEAMFAVATDTVYDDEKAGQVPFPKGEILECCILAMPTGWSWALFFCHGVISTASSLLVICSHSHFQPPSPGPGTVRRQCKSHRAHPEIM